MEDALQAGHAGVLVGGAGGVVLFGHTDKERYGREWARGRKSGTCQSMQILDARVVHGIEIYC